HSRAIESAAANSEHHIDFGHPRYRRCGGDLRSDRADLIAMERTKRKAARDIPHCSLARTALLPPCYRLLVVLRDGLLAKFSNNFNFSFGERFHRRFIGCFQGRFSIRHTAKAGALQKECENLRVNALRLL